MYTTQILDYDEENVFIPLPAELLETLKLREGDYVNVELLPSSLNDDICKD